MKKKRETCLEYPQELFRDRMKGNGPPFVQIGKKAIRYKVADLNNWINDRKKENTSQY